MSPFEVDGQRGMPSAGIALSIEPTVLLCRSLTEDSACAWARRSLREVLILRQEAHETKIGNVRHSALSRHTR
jgi:hypothetical protein